MILIKKKYKEHSHQSIEEIKRQQHKYKKDLIQPRDEGGELSQEYLKEYGSKNLRITEHDIRKMERKNPRFARKLTQDFKKQNGN